MPVYLDYLVRRCLAAGATMDLCRRIASLDEVRGAAATVINCTGLGARELVPDASMYASLGQLLVVENPGIDEFFQENAHGDELTYIFPHHDHVVLGGCSVHHVESYRPTAEVADAILERCVSIEPRLAHAKIIAHRVGLRPMREQARVEPENSGDTSLMHNYGHGAAGVSLSWGCAEQIGRILLETGYRQSRSSMTGLR